MGLDGGPSIQALDHCWGARWRVGPGEPMFYSHRRPVMTEIQHHVQEGKASYERYAVDQLEQLYGSRSLDWLYKNIESLCL